MIYNISIIFWRLEAAKSRYIMIVYQTEIEKMIVLVVSMHVYFEMIWIRWFFFLFALFCCCCFFHQFCVKANTNPQSSKREAFTWNVFDQKYQLYWYKQQLTVMVHIYTSIWLIRQSKACSACWWQLRKLLAWRVIFHSILVFFTMYHHSQINSFHNVEHLWSNYVYHHNRW